jgi:hypothetical protein
LYSGGWSIHIFGEIAAKELKLKPEIIYKSSSGDASGDYGSVVTYYAMGFF